MTQERGDCVDRIREALEGYKIQLGLTDEQLEAAVRRATAIPTVLDCSLDYAVCLVAFDLVSGKRWTADACQLDSTELEATEAAMLEAVQTGPRRSV